MKKLMVMMTLAAAAAAYGETYWTKAAANGKTPPACFVFYSDEACTETVTVTPAKDDGNTYVVMGSAKMTGTYTAPAGTHWVFGKDGVNIGTSAGRPAFYTNGGITLNYGEDCVIYGMKAQPNSSGNLMWAGTNTFVKTNQDIEFSVQNAESVNSRGADLCGAFKGESDVVVKFTRNNGQVGSTANYILSGDFSEYKGKFTASNGVVDRNTVLTLSSASAFGDPSVAATDYLTLNNFLTLVIDPAVVQYATKGITLNPGASGTCFIRADSGKDFTLTAPLVGSDGTLQKTGAGQLTMNGSVAIKKLVVAEGTLIVDTAASFAEGTTFTVKSGATVVSRVGVNIPNVTVTVEEGGSFSFDFTVPYDGENVTTLDMSTLSASDWSELVKPLPIQLSQAIPLPVNATNRLAVVKFPKALGVTSDDFKDATPKTYGLPVTWFEVESGDDADILWLVARPAVKLVAKRGVTADTPLLLAREQELVDGGMTNVWSDGLAAHEGADYVVDNGSVAVTGPGWSPDEFSFPGETLSFVSGNLALKHRLSNFKMLKVYGGMSVAANGYAYGDTYNTITGGLEIVSGTAYFNGGSGNLGKTDARRFHVDIASTVTGSGVLAFGSDSAGLSPRFSGDGTGFAGTISLQMGAHTALKFVDVLRLIGDREVTNPRALYGSSADTGFWATEDTTFEGVNYGFALQGVNDYFGVDEGKTFVLNGMLRFQDKAAAKYGLGTLALGGNILYQYDGALDPDVPWPNVGTVLSVHEGWVSPYAWNDAKSYRYLRLKFAANETAGIAVDPATTDENIRKYGMRLEKDTAIQFASADAKVYLKLALGAQEGQPLATATSFPVLTVKDALAETIADRLVAVKNVKNAKVRITSAPAADLEGFTTFTLSLEPSGLTIFIR